VLPWKYGFKSVKSIKRISFVDSDKMPVWAALAPTGCQIGHGPHRLSSV
jgi:DMSO/TMAO reductase YedYZ molybdopterin-dependent catalytic subunit